MKNNDINEKKLVDDTIDDILLENEKSILIEDIVNIDDLLKSKEIVLENKADEVVQSVKEEVIVNNDQKENVVKQIETEIIPLEIKNLNEEQKTGDDTIQQSQEDKVKEVSIENNEQSVLDNKLPMEHSVNVNKEENNFSAPNKVNFIENEKNKKINLIPLVIAGIIGLIVIIAIVIIFLFYKTSRDSEYIYEKSITYMFNEINESLMKYDNSNFNLNIGESSILNNSEISLKLEGIEGYSLNDSLLKFQFGIDANNEKLFANTTLIDNNIELLNNNYYYADSNTYAYLNGVFDKILLLVENEEIDFEIIEEIANKIDNASFNEVTKVTELLAKHISTNFDSKLFDTKEVSINVDGIDKEVTEHSYVIDNNEAKRFSVELLSKISNDKELIDSLATLLDTTSGEIYDEVMKIQNDISSSVIEDNNNTLTIKIYTEGFFSSFAGIEISSNDEKFKAFKIENNKFIILSTLYEEEKLYFTFVDGGIEIHFISEDSIDVKMLLQNTFTENEINTNIDFIFEEFKSDIKIDFSYSGITKVNTELPTIDYENSINVSDLTDLEIDNIKNTIEEKSMNNELVEMLSFYTDLLNSKRDVFLTEIESILISVYDEKYYDFQGELEQLGSDKTTCQDKVLEGIDEKYKYNVTFNDDNINVIITDGIYVFQKSYTNTAELLNTQDNEQFITNDTIDIGICN